MLVSVEESSFFVLECVLAPVCMLMYVYSVCVREREREEEKERKLDIQKLKKKKRKRQKVRSCVPVTVSDSGTFSGKCTAFHENIMSKIPVYF